MLSEFIAFGYALVDGERGYVFRVDKDMVVARRKELRIHAGTVRFLPNDISEKVVSTEYFVAENL